MSNYQDMIHRVADIICKNTSSGYNYILVGDNSTGKSDILQKVIKKKLGEAVYFIDSVNRTFDTDKVELVSKAFKNMRLDSREVVAERINLFNFNLRDTFHAASCIEQIFDKYSSRVYMLCKEYLNKEINIVREKLEAGVVENQVILNGNRVKLSSGYQAVVRLFTEILYFCDVMHEKRWDHGFVVIDELDEYLSPRHSADIFNFLQKSFQELNFLVTTHSLDMVECAKNANLIILCEFDYEIYTSRDLENTINAEAVFKRLFFKERLIHQSDDDSTDEKLRMLLNLKIAGLWDETAQAELEVMEYDQMQAHQKMIYRQIEEW